MGLSAFILLSVLLHPDGGPRNAAFACQCNPEHPLDRLEKSDAVFSGRVVDLAYLEYRGYVAMEVDTAWKGGPGKSVTIFDDIAGGCAVGFREGERYIVYASRTQGIFGEPVLGTHLCKGTRNLSWESVFDDVQVLGAGSPPASGSGTPAELRLYVVSFLSSYSALAVAVAAAAGTAGVLLAARRRKTGSRQ